MKALYDGIGVGYANLRKSDKRIAQAIHHALGDAKSVLNVGAGTGSYEPTGRHVTALEPSMAMIMQRPPGSARAYQGVAENLPFADSQFDAAMALLTVHHWSDLDTGLLEMCRVAKDRLVILTFDPESPYFWLTDYFPEIIDIDKAIMPELKAFEQVLGKMTVETVAISHDCTDGFLGAYWRRPKAYLDAGVRSAISIFSMLRDVTSPLKRLERDLTSGAWDEKYGHLMTAVSLDVGYRLIVSDLPTRARSPSRRSDTPG